MVNRGALWGRRMGLACLIALIPLTLQAEQPKHGLTVAGYYFDGAGAASPGGDYISKLLETKYADRKPLWGLEGRYGRDHREADRLLCRSRHRPGRKAKK